MPAWKKGINKIDNLLYFLLRISVVLLHGLQWHKISIRYILKIQKKRFKVKILKIFTMKLVSV